MRRLQTQAIIITSALALSAAGFSATRLFPGVVVNVSATAAPTEKGRIARLSYVDGGVFVRPYLVVFIDGDGVPDGALNVYARRSFDDGLTWDGPTLLSRDATGNPSGGQAITVDGTGFLATNRKASVFAPQIYADGKPRSVLVSWASSFCPDLSSGVYPNANQKINIAMTPNVPYMCVWTARSVDAGATWTVEQLTDATRDAANDVVAGSQSNNGFALAWQEDPLGLQPGEAEGPGDGGSGAHTTAGTNIWYTHTASLNAANPLLRGNIVQLTDNVGTPGPGDGPPVGPGASRPTLQMSGTTAAIVYEESKGGGGKNVFYHSFRFNTPDSESAGTLISDPTKTSRRARVVLQGDSAAGSSPLRALLLYRQGLATMPGAPADIIVLRGLKNPSDPESTGYRPQDLEPYTAAQNLSDPGNVIVNDNARAHRAIIRGSFIAAGYVHTPDMAAAEPTSTFTPTATYNFFVRTSYDAGTTWSAARNISMLPFPHVAIGEPRLVPTPGTITNPLTGVPEPGDVQNPSVFYVAMGTYSNDMEGADLWVYATRSLDQGFSYEALVMLHGAPGQSETQLRATPDGSSAAVLWMQQMAPTLNRDVLLTNLAPGEVSDTSTRTDVNDNCFIATAAYGTSLASEVRHLRAFRDRYLLTNSAGRAFMTMYYKSSPSVANFIREHEGLRAMVREALKPLVLFAREAGGTDSVAGSRAMNERKICGRTSPQGGARCFKDDPHER